MPVITDPERQRREIDAQVIPNGVIVEPSKRRYKNSVQAALENLERKETLRSETDNLIQSLQCKEKMRLPSSYSLSDDDALRVHNFPVYPPMFGMGPPAAGLTGPGPVFDWIKHMLTNKRTKHGGEK